MANVSKIKIETSTYDIKDASARSSLDKLATYSTSTEQEIGTWIDGKTIYRKVLTGTGDGNNAQYIARLQGIDTLVDMRVWVNGETTYFRNGTTVYYGDASWSSQCYYNKNNGYVSMECGNNFKNFKNGSPIKIIMEYTKTSS